MTAGYATDIPNIIRTTSLSKGNSWKTGKGDIRWQSHTYARGSLKAVSALFEAANRKNDSVKEALMEGTGTL